LASGAEMVKLKVAPGWDPGIVAAISATWPGFAVAVDANGSIAHQPQLLSSLDVNGVAYIEQPAPAGDDDALVALAAQLSVPVALDESATTASVLDGLLARGAGRIVNVKPSRVGGLVAALECVRTARTHDAAVFVGGMLETGVGRAAALALAAAVASDPGVVHLPTDLGPSAQYFDVDITDPVVVDDHGLLLVPDGPGIGVQPDHDRLADTCVERVTVGGR
jgi:o-succinylbenzoate synthase